MPRSSGTCASKNSTREDADIRWVRFGKICITSHKIHYVSKIQASNLRPMYCLCRPASLGSVSSRTMRPTATIG
jgi:hypothetical protein